MADPAGPGDDNGWDEEEEELLRNIGDHSLLSGIQKRLADQLTRKKYRCEGAALRTGSRLSLTCWLLFAELRCHCGKSQRTLTARGSSARTWALSFMGCSSSWRACRRSWSPLTTTRTSLETSGRRRRGTWSGCGRWVVLISRRFVALSPPVPRLLQAFKERKAQVDVEEKKLEHAKGEVEGINETIRQAEAYDKQMKSEIAVTRRETYAAEEAVTKLEKAKAAQDLFIDGLNEEYKAKGEELGLYESRLATQREEAAAASATLSDALKEMEVIQGEKKQLLVQWQTTLIGIQKRNEALQVRVLVCCAAV